MPLGGVIDFLPVLKAFGWWARLGPVWAVSGSPLVQFWKSLGADNVAVRFILKSRQLSNDDAPGASDSSFMKSSHWCPSVDDAEIHATPSLDLP